MSFRSRSMRLPSALTCNLGILVPSPPWPMEVSTQVELIMYMETFGLSEVNTSEEPSWACDLNWISGLAIKFNLSQASRHTGIETNVARTKLFWQRSTTRGNDFHKPGLTVATEQSKTCLVFFCMNATNSTVQKKELTAEKTIRRSCRGKCFSACYISIADMWQVDRRGDRWASSCITSRTWRELSARPHFSAPALIWAPLY